jgi:6,7-dimethyl-8-ribityllumazine synthase
MTEFRGSTIGQGLKIAIISSEFAEKDGGALARLRETAKSKLTELEAEFDIFYCPGVFEIPTVAAKILRTGKYDALVTLGVVVRGETAHFDFVCKAATDGVAALGRESGVPVLFGVLTTETTEQAVARGRLGADYAQAAVEMANLLKQI